MAAAQRPHAVGGEKTRGAVGQWAVDQVGVDRFDDGVTAVDELGLDDGQVGVGEKRVVAPVGQRASQAPSIPDTSDSSGVHEVA
jgi:hypothetical protein